MKKKLIITLGLGLLCSYSSIHAQKNHLETAQTAFASEKYATAIDHYKKAESKAKKPEEKARINYQLGLCYDYITQYDQAEVYYHKAKTLKYDQADPNLLLQTGRLKMKQGNFKDAQNYLKKYLEKVPRDSVAIKDIEKCSFAIELIKSPTRHIILEEVQLNSNHFEFSSSFADKKHNTLVFASTRTGSTGSEIDGRLHESYSDLWVTTRDNKGKWDEPKPLSASVNSEVNEGTPAFSYKKDKLYFTRCDIKPRQSVGCDIYESKKQGSNWAIATSLNLKPQDADSISIGHPAINKKGDMLIFSGDLPNGYGGNDLWKSYYDPKTKTWSAPINLGPEINTSRDEVFPFLDNDNNLYFASNGHLGLGGLDNFLASAGDNSFNTPINLGYPLNSTKDDFGLIMDKSHNGFFTSNRSSNNKFDNLYSFNLPAKAIKIICIVKDAATKEIIPNAKITVSRSDGEIRSFTTDLDGEVNIDDNDLLLENYNFSISANYEDYFTANSKVTTEGIENSKTYYEEFYLYKPIIYDLPEVRYDYADSALQVITDSVNSKDSLDYLYNLMINNPSWIVELQAHTDCRGSFDYNEILSQGRANKCVEYLVSKGIEKSRLVPVGYGENNPIKNLSCAEIERMATTKEREIAHQRNRRTVFKILSDNYKSE